MTRRAASESDAPPPIKGGVRVAPRIKAEPRLRAEFSRATYTRALAALRAMCVAVDELRVEGESVAAQASYGRLLQVHDRASAELARLDATDEHVWSEGR